MHLCTEIYETDDYFSISKKTGNQFYIKWYCHEDGLKTLTWQNQKQNWCYEICLRSCWWRVIYGNYLFAPWCLLSPQSISMCGQGCNNIFGIRCHKEAEQKEVIQMKLIWKLQGYTKPKFLVSFLSKIMHHLLEKAYVGLLTYQQVLDSTSKKFGQSPITLQSKSKAQRPILTKKKIKKIITTAIKLNNIFFACAKTILWIYLLIQVVQKMHSKM